MDDWWVALSAGVMVVVILLSLQIGQRERRITKGKSYREAYLFTMGHLEQILTSINYLGSLSPIVRDHRSLAAFQGVLNSFESFLTVFRQIPPVGIHPELLRPAHHLSAMLNQEVVAVGEAFLKLKVPVDMKKLPKAITHQGLRCCHFCARPFSRSGRFSKVKLEKSGENLEVDCCSICMTERQRNQS